MARIIGQFGHLSRKWLTLNIGTEQNQSNEFLVLRYDFLPMIMQCEF